MKTSESWLCRVLVIALCAATGPIAGAQENNLAPPEKGVAQQAAELPDSPGALLVARTPEPDAFQRAAQDKFQDPTQNPTTRTRPARRFHRIVRPDELAEPLSGTDKLELSVMSRLSVMEIFTTAFSAGFSQLRDSKPHYGTDSGAFGQRLGALALKQTSQSIFSYGIYAAAMHDDPRYYVMGPRHNLGTRALYAGTRVFVTRKDDGSATANLPKFAGIASATALTNLYYPQDDHGFKNFRDGALTSIATSILNNEIHEFIGDLTRIIHRRH